MWRAFLGFLHTFWAVGSCAGQQQWVLTGSTCSAVSIPTTTQQHPKTPSTEMPPANTNTFPAALQLLAVPSPGKVQQGLCLKDDRAHLRFPVKVGQLEGHEHPSGSTHPCSHRDLPLSPNDKAVRGQHTSKGHMDMVGPCSHHFLLLLVLSWMCLCVYGGG